MGWKKWIEGTCDYCGRTNNWNTLGVFKDYGWIIKDKKMFCDEYCHKGYYHKEYKRRLGR